MQEFSLSVQAREQFWPLSFWLHYQVVVSR